MTNETSEGGRCAKIKNQSRGSKTFQEDRNREDKGQKGFCSAYTDEEIGQSETRSPNPKVHRAGGCKRDKGVDPLCINRES